MSNRGFLEDAATRHQIYVERFAGGSLKALAVFLLRALTMAKSRVADGLSAYGTARYDKQIAALHQDLLGVYSEMGDESLGQLRDFGVYEATYNATLLGKAVKAVVQLNTPSPQIVSAAALVQPMRLETGKRHAKLNIAGALDQYGVKKSAEIVGEIRIGSALGETSNQIAARLNSMGVLQRSQAEALTRTMTNHIATSARTQTLQENADILDGMRIIATLDSRTTILCASLDQDVIALDAPGPPFHWNACAKGTMVSTMSGPVAIEDVQVGDLVLTHMGRYKRVTAVMARVDSGRSRELVNNFGARSRLTNDHPVLTLKKGWIKSGDIEIGDVVFNGSEELSWPKSQVRSLPIEQHVLLDAHNIKTDLAESLVAHSVFSRSTGMSSAIQLNNGFIDHEIGVVSEDSVLAGVANAKAVEQISEHCFVGRGIGLECPGYSVSCLEVDGLISKRIGGCHDFGVDLGEPFGCLGVSQAPMPVSGRVVAEDEVVPGSLSFWFHGNSEDVAALSEGVVGESALSLDPAEALSKPVILGFDQASNKVVANGFSHWYNSTIIGIAEYQCEQWVYNLSVEDDETYVADSMLVHNCRTTVVPVLKAEYARDIPGSTRPSKGADGVAPVSSKTSYPEWLARQPASFQKDVLGRTRYELFSKGKLDIDKFVDNGRTLTLDQLREREPASFERAGLN